MCILDPSKHCAPGSLVGRDDSTGQLPTPYWFVPSYHLFGGENQK